VTNFELHVSHISRATSRQDHSVNTVLQDSLRDGGMCAMLHARPTNVVSHVSDELSCGSKAGQRRDEGVLI
jgi:hypothetical protein